MSISFNYDALTTYLKRCCADHPDNRLFEAPLFPMCGNPSPKIKPNLALYLLHAFSSLFFDNDQAAKINHTNSDAAQSWFRKNSSGFPYTDYSDFFPYLKQITDIKATIDRNAYRAERDLVPYKKPFVLSGVILISGFFLHPLIVLIGAVAATAIVSRVLFIAYQNYEKIEENLPSFPNSASTSIPCTFQHACQFCLEELSSYQKDLVFKDSP